MNMNAPTERDTKSDSVLMASSTQVRVLEVTKIAPSVSTIAASTFELTFFDLFWVNFAPVERLFFYHHHNINHESFNSEILPKLKNSLSLVLTHFFPLAGNIVWPSPDASKPIIRYTPKDSVSFTVAESNQDFNNISSHNIQEAIALHPLVPLLNVSDDVAALLALQVTLFPNQGFSIGTAMHHAAMDGKSVTMFNKAWAYICRTSQEDNNNSNVPLPFELIPFLDRTIIKDPNRLHIKYTDMMRPSESDPIKRRSLKLPQNLGTVDKNLVRATFQFTKENIKKLREQVLSEVVGKSKPLHLSTFVLTMAYTSNCMVKAKEGEKERIVIYIFAADYRKRLEFPVPDNYFGNCFSGRLKVIDGIDPVNGNWLVIGAETLSDEIKVLEKGNVLDGAKEKYDYVMKTVKESGKEVQVISVGGSPNFAVYELDFGWGRPKKVEIVSVDRTGTVALDDNGDGNGGVEIGLALEKQEMERFASLFHAGLHL